MELDNYKYYKIDLPIKEIAKINVKSNTKNVNIENIDIENTTPNILIYQALIDQKPNYENIFGTVKILITNGLWSKIPESIEYIIAYKKIYKNNKDKFDFLDVEDDERRKEIIDELIKEDRINEWNINDETTQTKSEFNFTRHCLLMKQFYI